MKSWSLKSILWRRKLKKERRTRDRKALKHQKNVIKRSQGKPMSKKVAEKKFESYTNVGVFEADFNKNKKRKK